MRTWTLHKRTRVRHIPSVCSREQESRSHHPSPLVANATGAPQYRAKGLRMDCSGRQDVSSKGVRANDVWRWILCVGMCGNRVARDR
jgi:hypothetical protein